MECLLIGILGYRQ